MSACDDVVVYQPGKVGSRSIVTALERARFKVAHVHMLNEKRLEHFVSQCVEKGLEPPPYLPDAHRIQTEYLKSGRRMKVVSAVRDPVARNLSAYFQNIDQNFPEWRRLKKHQLPLVAERFLNDYPHHVIKQWFDVELCEVLEVDIFAKPFEFERGAGEYQSKRGDILIVRAEDDNRLKEQALRRFLGCGKIMLGNENKGASRPWGSAYKSLMRRIVFPESYLDDMYGSKMARYFYTDAERTEFRRRHRGLSGD